MIEFKISRRKKTRIAWIWANSSSRLHPLFRILSPHGKENLLCLSLARLPFAQHFAALHPGVCVGAVGMHKRHTQVSNACFCRHRRRRRRRLTHAILLLRAARSFHARDVHSARAVSAAQSSVAAASDANTARFKLYQTWVTRRTLHSATTLDQNNKKNQEQVN